ncbi:hypothetical protein BDY21DRAFT_373786 [Lineolata rhizophorae]|uniref:Uncharacterized protein n=1 Tax=Lineolata rhizophorae TaxID=578093 RepID=A0A6A6NTT3_9PEZI|nr:hypothetical protein BDY21DRAFT_373786 [Lineolata rhizophorae]
MPLRSRSPFLSLTNPLRSSLRIARADRPASYRPPHSITSAASFRSSAVRRESAQPSSAPQKPTPSKAKPRVGPHHQRPSLWPFLVIIGAGTLAFRALVEKRRGTAPPNQQFSHMGPSAGKKVDEI